MIKNTFYDYSIIKKIDYSGWESKNRKNRLKIYLFKIHLLDVNFQQHNLPQFNIAQITGDANLTTNSEGGR